MKTKTQILMIHGGMTFKNKKDYLDYLKNKEKALKIVKDRIEFFNKSYGYKWNNIVT